MQRYGLIGKTLGHSFSKLYFESHHPEVQYDLFEIDCLDDLRRWTKGNALSGFNVTIPYKVTILPFLDTITPEASAIGAVNCVKVVPDPSHEDGIQLTGHNTDSQAFLETLKDIIGKAGSFQPSTPSAWILGNGGAAKAVAHALQKLQISNKMLGHADINNLNRADSHHTIPPILINATPVGMFPYIDATPLPFLNDKNKCTYPSPWICYDLIYNPTETRLMQDAVSMGATTLNGLQMLYRQAELSLSFWTNKNS